MQSSQFAILEALHAYRQSQRQFHYSSEILIIFIARQIWASIAEIIAIGTEESGKYIPNDFSITF